MSDVDASPFGEQPSLPDRLGDYAIERELGSGAFGIVYLANDLRRDHRVALKVLRRENLGKSTEARLRAEVEALRILADEGHHHFPRVHEAGRFERVPFVAMDHIAGGPIDDYCDARQLTVRQRLQLFVHVCRAVQKAHRNGIVHRDLKPQHILVHEDDDGQLALGPRIIDFGIARGLGFALDLDVQTAGAMVGTPGFMSPEQAGGQRVNVQTDVYSLGVVLFLLLTGCMPREREPRSGESVAEHAQRQLPTIDRRFAELAQADRRRAEQIAHRRSTSIDGLQRELRGDLRLIVQWATYAERGLRYADIAALIDDVQNYLDLRPVRARQGSRLYELALWLKRRRDLVATATSLLLSLSFAVLFLWQQAETAEAKGKELTATLEQERGVALAAGRRLAERGKWRAALELFDKAEATGIGDRHTIGIERVRALEASYQEEAAVELLATLLPTASRPQRARLLLLRGDLGKRRFEDPDDGLDDVAEALAIDRQLRTDGARAALDDAERHYAEALLADTPRAALAALRSARFADAGDHRVNQCYAMTLILLGEREAAIRFAGTFQAQNPDYEEAHYVALMMHALGDDDEIVQASIGAIARRFGDDSGELAATLVEVMRLLPWANETIQQSFLARERSLTDVGRIVWKVGFGVAPLLTKLSDRRESRRLRGLEDSLMRVPPSLARQYQPLRELIPLRLGKVGELLAPLQRNQVDGSWLFVHAFGLLYAEDGPAALRRLDDALASSTMLIDRRVQLAFATMAGTLIHQEARYGLADDARPAARQQILAWLSEWALSPLTPAELQAAAYAARKLEQWPTLAELLLRHYRAEPDTVLGRLAYVDALFVQHANDEARRMLDRLRPEIDAFAPASLERQTFRALERALGK